MPYGRIPKDPSVRRNRVVPGRGEWVELAASNQAEPPAMPAPEPKGGWSTGTRSAWAVWWGDAASTMWSPGDHEMVRQLAYLVDALDAGNVRVAGEIRLRLDGLGLSPKGKREFRWRVAGDPTDLPRTPPPSSRAYSHLRGVE